MSSYQKHSTKSFRGGRKKGKTGPKLSFYSNFRFCEIGKAFINDQKLGLKNNKALSVHFKATSGFVKFDTIQKNPTEIHFFICYNIF